MGFELFKYKSGHCTLPLASIYKSGLISFNKVAMERYFKLNRFVRFYYDKNNNAIGIEYGENEHSNSYKMTTSRDGKICTVRAKSFLLHYGINHDVTVGYQFKKDPEKNFLIIELRETK
jgi:hypothetical protein